MAEKPHVRVRVHDWSRTTGACPKPPSRVRANSMRPRSSSSSILFLTAGEKLHCFFFSIISCLTSSTTPSPPSPGGARSAQQILRKKHALISSLTTLPPPPSPPPQAEHASAQQDVSAAEQQPAASADTVLSLEEAMRAAEKRYAFVQGLRQYLAVLCDFLKVSIGRLCVQQLDSSPSSHHP